MEKGKLILPLTLALERGVKGHRSVSFSILYSDVPASFLPNTRHRSKERGEAGRGEKTKIEEQNGQQFLDCTYKYAFTYTYTYTCIYLNIKEA